MKILIAVTSFLSYRLVEGQIQNLSSQGFTVYFSSTYNEKVKEAVEKEGGVFCPLDIDREINLFKDLKSLTQASKLIHRIQPDIINVSTPKASLIFSLISILYKKPKLLFTLRGLRSDTLRGVKYKIIKFTETLCCDLADYVIVISPSLKNHAVSKNILKEKKAIIIGKGSSNGINLNRFSVNDQTQSFAQHFRSKFNLTENNVVFGYVGRLVEDKGIKELYIAFKIINNKFPNTRLLLVGSVEDGDPLPQAFIDNLKDDPNVILLDYTDKIENVYSVMDCFILYSYREGFGNVAVEAAAMELPVIVANIPGLKDTVENNLTGFLAESKNYEDLEKKMTTYFKNPELRHLHGQNGRKRVVNYFSSEFIWKEQLKIYNMLLNR